MVRTYVEAEFFFVSSWSKFSALNELRLKIADLFTFEGVELSNAFVLF